MGRSSPGCLALCAAVLGGSLYAGEVTAERPGRVIRIERPRLAAQSPVRACIMIDPAAGSAVCYGEAPPAGTSFTVIDEEGVRGRATSGLAEPSEQDLCGFGTPTEVELLFDGTVAPARTGFSLTMAVAGLELAEEGRLVRDPDVGVENVWLSFDRNGSGLVDFLVTARECTDEVGDLPNAPGGKRTSAYCIDYLLRDGLEWTKRGGDVFYSCM